MLFIAYFPFEAVLTFCLSFVCAVILSSEKVMSGHLLVKSFN